MTCHWVQMKKGKDKVTGKKLVDQEWGRVREMEQGITALKRKGRCTQKRMKENLGMNDMFE